MSKKLLFSRCAFPRIVNINHLVVNVLMVVLFLLISADSAKAILDANSNGMSDVWEQVYSAEDLEPTGDEDQDYRSNLEESIDGTDPFDRNSVIQFVGNEFISSGVFVSWQSRSNVRYQVESSSTMQTDDWHPLGDIVIGNGDVMSVIYGNDSNSQFFQIRVLGRFSEVVDTYLVMEGIDTDGDGETDIDEIERGDDPFEAGTSTIVPEILTGGGTRLCWKSEKGKLYQLRSRGYDLGEAWVNEGTPHLGTGEPMGATAISPTGQMRLYEIVVQDVDSDGDGLTDWEEHQLGLNSQMVNTNKSSDSDLAEAIQIMGETSSISVHSFQSIVNVTRMENGGFVIERDGGVEELMINYSVSGSAVANSDYQALSGSVILPYGMKSVVVPVLPLESANIELSESVVLTLQNSNDYNIGEHISQQLNVIREVPINVMDYGAVGNGIADDTLAIQAAIDALEASTMHNTLYFPSGKYRLNTAYYTTHTTNTSLHRSLILGDMDLVGRDIVVSGEGDSILYSTLSPLRAKMFMVMGTFRSLSFRDMQWEKDDVLLSKKVGLEPNGAAGVCVIDVDDRDVESIEFRDCIFVNCHRSVTVDFAPYSRKGKLRKVGFYNSRFMNPYGSNTIDGNVALGGGQQVYISPWVNLVEYIGNYFDGAGDQMTGENNPDGIVKDGAHFGSPLAVIFKDNVVRRMGVEAFYQTDDVNRLGSNSQSFEIPPADGETEVDIQVDFSVLPIPVGEYISTYIGSRKHNIFKITRKSGGNTLTVINEGYENNEQPGVIVSSRRQMFLQTNERTSVLVERNIFSECGYGVVACAKSEIRGNVFYNCPTGVMINRPASAVLYPPDYGANVVSNFISSQEGDVYYNNGIYIWGECPLVMGNRVNVSASRLFCGIRLVGLNGHVYGNVITADDPVINGYGSYQRGLGIGLQWQSSAGAVIEKNTTKRFDVGVGPLIPHDVVPHIVREHISIGDQLGVDPRGLIVE